MYCSSFLPHLPLSVSKPITNDLVVINALAEVVRSLNSTSSEDERSRSTSSTSSSSSTPQDPSQGKFQTKFMPDSKLGPLEEVEEEATPVSTPIIKPATAPNSLPPLELLDSQIASTPLPRGDEPINYVSNSIPITQPKTPLYEGPTSQSMTVITRMQHSFNTNSKSYSEASKLQVVEGHYNRAKRVHSTGKSSI